MLEDQIFDELCIAIAAAQPAEPAVYGLIRMEDTFCLLPVRLILEGQKIYCHISGNEINNGPTESRWQQIANALAKFYDSQKSTSERKKKRTEKQIKD